MKVHDILQGMQDLHEDGPQFVDSQRSAWRDALRQRPARHASGGLASVGDLAKSKTKEKGKAGTASAFNLAF